MARQLSKPGDKDVKLLQKEHKTKLNCLNKQIEVADAQFRRDFKALDAEYASTEEAFRADYRSKLRKLQALKLEGILNRHASALES